MRRYFKGYKHRNTMSDIIELLNEIDQNDDQFDEQDNVFQLSRQDIQNERSMQLMIDYIRTHKSDIPEEYRGSCLVDMDNLTLAMHWVYMMKTAPVPQWMRHDPNMVDNEGWPIAMHWIFVNHTEPPLWMHCSPDIQNATFKKTIAMVYLLYRKDELKNVDVPEWMRHDLHIFDRDGFCLIDYWLCNNDLPIPEWMLKSIDDSFVNGRKETVEQMIKIYTTDDSVTAAKTDSDQSSETNDDNDAIKTVNATTDSTTDDSINVTTDAKSTVSTSKVPELDDVD